MRMEIIVGMYHNYIHETELEEVEIHTGIYIHMNRKMEMQLFYFQFGHIMYGFELMGCPL